MLLLKCVDSPPSASLWALEKPCDICGDCSNFEAIITCCECKSARQHLYCMKTLRSEAPMFWVCEECDSDKELISPKTSAKEDLPDASTQKTSSLMHHGCGVSGDLAKMTYASRFNFKEKKVEKGKTKYISCDEAVRLSTTVLKKTNLAPTKAFHSTKPQTVPSNYLVNANPMPRKLGGSMATQVRPTMHRPVFQQSTPQKGGSNFVQAPRKGGGNAGLSVEALKPLKSQERTNTERDSKMEKKTALPPRNERGEVVMALEALHPLKRAQTTCTKTGGKDGHKKNLNVENPDAKIQNESNSVRFLYAPAADAYWRGIFFLSDKYANFNDAFNAHPPSTVHNKVYETLKKMPEDLFFELLPHKEVWMDIFPHYLPDKDDIGLYFFPRFKRSSKDTNISFMDIVCTKKLVLKSNVDGVELLVFPSELLQPDSQRFEGSYFLWGVFRRVCRQSIKKIPSSTSDSSYLENEEMVVDMEIDDENERFFPQKPSIVKRESCDDSVPPGFTKIYKS